MVSDSLFDELLWGGKELIGLGFGEGWWYEVEWMLDMELWDLGDSE